jgi:hypothetical protein
MRSILFFTINQIFKPVLVGLSTNNLPRFMRTKCLFGDGLTADLQTELSCLVPIFRSTVILSVLLFFHPFLATDYSVASFKLLDFTEFSKRTPFDVFMIIFLIEWFLKVWLCLFRNQAKIFLFQVFHCQGGWFSNISSWISQDHALMQFPEVSCIPNCYVDAPGCNIFGIC